jgi:hypothetical protein
MHVLQNNFGGGDVDISRYHFLSLLFHKQNKGVLN